MGKREIEIDLNTQKALKEINNAIGDLQIRSQIIVNTYINAKGGEGEFQLSKDFTKLILKENE